MPTILPTPVPTAEENLPEITAVTLDRIELPRYESLEMTVELEAEYNNPYDAREVTLDGTFIAPNGGQMLIPGFWDGEEAWRVRFTPSEEGEWGYSLTITDANGTSQPNEGRFNVTHSELHGWLLPGSSVNPDYNSPAIGMWQTVSEINGTNAYDQADFWHNRVNAYFIANDPYRHPTTASQSGDVDWEEGHLNMDAPQVHLYDFDDPVGAAELLAEWTTRMWQRAEKPNWVGEFGVPGNERYPELFHNSIWAALSAGAAMTPAEWNSGGSWGRMTPEMLGSIARLGQFVSELPLAALNPSLLQIGSSDPEVRGWGVAGEAGGLFWLQDFALDGQPIAEVRANQTDRQGVSVQIDGLADGRYTITPYDTWQGTFLDAFDVTCTAGSACTIPLPQFKADMAFKIERS
jgi:hypothetical protein